MREAGLLNDYLSLLPSTLARVAGWLSGQFGVWWPMWVGALFPVYAAILSFVVWVLRGRTWPVRCLYPWTQEEWPCENWVAGEWYRCHRHNKVKHYKHHGGHWVDPGIKRWQIGNYGTGTLVDRPVEGIGFVRVRPTSHALLYRKGYARRPQDVFFAIPEYVRESIRRLRATQVRGSSEDTEVPLLLGKDGVRDATAENLHAVVSATRSALVAFALSLVMSAVAVLVTPPEQSYIQWMGTLGFVCAWSALSSGIWQRREDWLSNACSKSVKWWLTIFAPVALLNLLVTAPTS